MACDDLAGKAHAGVKKSGLAVAMSRLVEVHEIHVDLRPWQIPIELGMQMQEWLAQRREATDPHFCGRKCVHPQNQTRALRTCVGFENRGANRIGCREDRLENNLQGQLFAKPAGDCLRVDGHLLESLGTVEVLTAGEEPDFGCVHFRDWDLSVRSSFITPERSALRFTPPNES